ncbi:hypothetical protein N183_08120 [Sinorhizobium sp. Sb3]|nr:hypothetical protein N183_08120 [Sinorhizobium sp. Sb3]
MSLDDHLSDQIGRVDDDDLPAEDPGLRDVFGIVAGAPDRQEIRPRLKQEP